MIHDPRTAYSRPMPDHSTTTPRHCTRLRFTDADDPYHAPGAMQNCGTWLTGDDRCPYERLHPRPAIHDDSPVHPCHSRAAHLPHAVILSSAQLGTDVYICAGIVPIWPCTRAFQGFTHDPHTGAIYDPETRPFRDVHCPGTATPPREMQGPPYDETHARAHVIQQQRKEPTE